MVGAIHAVRAAVKGTILALLRPIKLTKNEHGHYTPAAIDEIINRAAAALKEHHNQGCKDGFAGIADATDALSQVKSDTYVDPEDVLANTVHEKMKKIDTSDRAERYADRENAKYEGALGAKFAVKEWFVGEVGEDAVRTVIFEANRTTIAHHDTFTIPELYACAKEVATDKSPDEVVVELVELLQTQFDFRDPFSTNLKKLETAQTAVETSGQPTSIPQRLIVIIRNIKNAAKTPGGKVFEEVVRKLKKDYPSASYIHNEESYKKVVALVNAADKLRDKKDAPEPEQALYSYSRFGDEKKDASDSESHRSDDSADSRSRHSSQRAHGKGRGRGNGTGRGQRSSPGSEFSREEHEKAGACPHCVKFGFKCLHLLYKTKSNCAYNPSFKGYRHERACLLLGTDHKARCFFTPAKGGWDHAVAGRTKTKLSPTAPVQDNGSLDSGSVSSTEAAEEL